METVVITIFAVTFIILLKLLGKSRQERLLDALPGPAGYPLIGNYLDILQIKQSFLRFSMENQEKFGPMYKTWIGSTPVVHISKASHIEMILNNEGVTRVPDKNSLITKSLKLHPHTALRNRKMVISNLNSKDPNYIINIARKSCRMLVEALKKRLTEELDMGCITLCVLDIISEIVLGVKINSQFRENDSFVSSLLKLREMSKKNYKIRFYSDSLFRRTTFGREYSRHENVVKNFIKKVIEDKRYKKQSNGTSEEKVTNVKATDVIHDLMLFNGLYSTEEIQNDALNIILTAQDSIDSSILTVLYVLGSHPSVQEKAQHDIETVYAKRGGSNNITLKDLQKMTYFDKVIKETFRLYPFCPFILKELKRDIKIDNYLIPQDTTICIQVVSLQRDPETFPSGENFDPNNFFGQKAEKRSRFAFLPFTDCIGQRLTEIIQRIILTILITTFKIETIDKSSDRFASISNYIYGNKSDMIVRISQR